MERRASRGAESPHGMWGEAEKENADHLQVAPPPPRLAGLSAAGSGHLLPSADRDGARACEGGSPSVSRAPSRPPKMHTRETGPTNVRGSGRGLIQHHKACGVLQM